MSISKMNVKTTVKHSCLHCLDANHWLCKFSPLPFSCCTAFALEVLRVDVVDPATLATLTWVRSHDMIFPVTDVMTGNRSHDLSLF